MNRIVRTIGSIILAVAAIMGLKLYNKSSTKSEIRDRLVEICETDTACLDAVDEHFESCFEQNFTLGGRRQSSKLDSAGVVSCINSEAGVEYFSYEE